MKNKLTTLLVLITISTIGQTSKLSTKSWKINSSKNYKTTHNHNELDNNATNVNSVQFVPIYPGCEIELDEYGKKNCFVSKISTYTQEKMNKSIIQNSGLNYGIKKMRVLFIIDKNGKTKVKKIIGTWPTDIKNEIKRVLETVPRMKPGILNGKVTPVKYSLQIPLNIS